MKENVGGWDRNTRWILGAAGVVTAMVAPLPRSLRTLLLTFSAAQFITAGTRYCPLNRALGVNTGRSFVDKALHKVVSLAT